MNVTSEEKIVIKQESLDPYSVCSTKSNLLDDGTCRLSYDSFPIIKREPISTEESDIKRSADWCCLSTSSNCQSLVPPTFIILPYVSIVKNRCTECNQVFAGGNKPEVFSHVCIRQLKIERVWSEKGLLSSSWSNVKTEEPHILTERPRNEEEGSVNSIPKYDLEKCKYEIESNFCSKTSCSKFCFSVNEFCDSCERQNCTSCAELAKERPFKCNQCGITFSQKTALKTHRRVHSKGKVQINDAVVCRKQGKMSPSRRKSGKKTYKWSVCKQTCSSYVCENFGTENSFPVTSAKNYKTDRNNLSTTENLVVDSDFTETYNLKDAHSRGCKSYKDTISQKCLPNNHQNSLREITKIADSDLNCLSSVNCHVGLAMEPKPFVCANCSRSFASKYGLSEHSRVVHEGDKPFTCVQCDKTFGSKSTMMKHIRRVHSRDKPHVCSECGVGCLSKSDLSKHLRIHTGETEFKCRFCVASFSCKSYLNRHMFVHTGEKRFKCETCDKRFAYKSHLQIHYRVHTREKPYKCNVCEEDIKSKRELQRHARLHSDEKPYKCS